jgi:hypothetical protein
MKLIFVLILVLLYSSSLSQDKREFSDLCGLEDKNGNTHLFYRIYELKENQNFSNDGYEINNIYHLDISVGKDTLFLKDVHYDSTGYFEIVNAFDFWHNDPSKYIYGGVLGGFDGSSFIKRFDNVTSYGLMNGSVNKIFISWQNDSLVYASEVDRIIEKSTDGGLSWQRINDLTNPRGLLSVSPYNDQYLFLLKNFLSLNASTDGGKTFIDLNIDSNNGTAFYFDPDSIHIYAVISQGYGSVTPVTWYLKVSDGIPDFYSFRDTYSIKPQNNKILLAVDNSISGTVYAATGNLIYKSSDYGKSFSLYKTLNRKIVNIYKKPDSEILYAATKFDILEITPAEVKIIKHIQPAPGLFQWYPLAKSNKWIYKNTQVSFGEQSSDIITREVIGERVSMDSVKYFEIQETSEKTNFGKVSFERIDSNYAIVYKLPSLYITVNSEIPWIDLSSELNDTTGYLNSGALNYQALLLYSQDYFKFGDKNYRRNNFKEVFTDPAGFYSLSKNIGLSNYGYSGYQTENTNTLTGYTINGKAYGDTSVSIVSVNENKIIIKDFSLEQNYPNPFNPVTTIKYTLPTISKSPFRKGGSGDSRGGFVSLTVYDLLGRNVQTLVNELQQPGNYQVVFDGSRLAGGIYFYVLNNGETKLCRKMCLLK